MLSGTGDAGYEQTGSRSDLLRWCVKNKQCFTHQDHAPRHLLLQESECDRHGNLTGKTHQHLLLLKWNFLCVIQFILYHIWQKSIKDYEEKTSGNIPMQFLPRRTMSLSSWDLSPWIHAADHLQQHAHFCSYNITQCQLAGTNATSAKIK